MRLISDVVEAWLELQRRWMYLEGIFIGGDIRSQLPQEAQRFDDVDETFRNVMLETVKNPNVLMSCSVPSEYPPSFFSSSNYLIKFFFRSSGGV